MSKPHGIIVFGANGSGKSTIARELANILNFKHMDIEDYHFEKSEMPYTIERSHEDCLKLMLADIKKIAHLSSQRSLETLGAQFCRCMNLLYLSQHRLNYA